MPKKIKPVACWVCGRATIYPTTEAHPYKYADVNICYNCGGDQRDRALMSQLPEEVTLQCPFIKPGTGKRCTGERTFPASAFRGTACTGGNGPHTYSIVSRFELQGRCQECNQYYFDNALIRGNIKRIRELVERVNEEREAA